MLFLYFQPMKKFIAIFSIATLIVTGCKTKKDNSKSTANAIQKEEVSKTKIGDTITLESGLRYKIIKEGIGEKPKSTSKVRVHYEGTLDDGTVFDSSIARGKPIVLPVNRVIKGWQEGLLLMKEGAVYEMYIPPNLGYGSRAAGKIPPFSHLNFRVELLEVL